ncbi:hypothetical protein EB837_02150 [Kluyvera ascorbata]|uniref:Uncharacterized protein n=1 Tax=Kluyvera ascorbata TaxID=51288 RepID=A0A3N2SDJ1_9ENTR|nr:hypothetical protein [Kluyvera ascorbata]ROU17651.1 hypothetical protein EB837_02150 [Kluyvera ascorbata]
MNDSFIFDCAIKLCSADHVSGYVSANPVIDTREKITEKRLAFIYQLLSNVKNKTLQQCENRNEDEIEYCFEKAVQLTSSDISCGVIAVEPILYDRDQKICETIEFYYSMVTKTAEDFSISLVSKCGDITLKNTHESFESSVEYKTVVIPVYQKMKKSKIKKGKR